MKTISILKLIWGIACLALLIFAYKMQSSLDADIFFAYAILTLTFPVGILLQGIISLSRIPIPFTFTATLVIWAVFVFCGYLQWFVALPRLINFIKKKQLTKHSSGLEDT